jgi:hypothetical protein
MAHFAQLDENNIVLQVVVVNNNDCQIDGVENEEAGISFCKSLFGAETRWVQTSYNCNFRKNYAGVGDFYDSQRDAFIPPKSYPSWIFDEETCDWVSPVPNPSNGKPYVWDETNLSWVEVLL